MNHNLNYQETAARYGCSYQQIYTWCSKAENDGVHALEVRRGKRKTQEFLSSEEQLKKENEEFRKENEILKRQAELLKKLNQKGRGCRSSAAVAARICLSETPYSKI